MARRDDGEYWAYSTEEQRRQAECLVGRMPREFHHGLLGRLGCLILMSVVAVGCVHEDGLRPEPFPRPSTPPGAVSSSVSVSDALVITATGLAGIPYQQGGDTPNGFDCSGFTRFVFAQHGVSLPRLTWEQYREGRPVAAGDVRPGDLVFFTTIAPGASHVGVAVTRDEFVHAPSEHGVVRVERLSERYWASRYLGARRVVE